MDRTKTLTLLLFLLSPISGAAQSTAEGLLSTSPPSVDLTDDELFALQDAYVDPQIARGRVCPDYPFQPGWVMIQPLGFQWKTRLFQENYNLIRSQRIVELGECSCDLLYPPWDDFRSELEALAAEWPDVSGPDMSEDQSLNIMRHLSTLARSNSSIGKEFRSICNTVLKGE